MVAVWALGAVVAAVAVAWIVRRRLASTTDGTVLHDAPRAAVVDPSPDHPASGVLVSEEVVRLTESGALSVWEALEQATVPIAVEYFPISDSDVTRYQTVPINGAAQQSIAHIVKSLGPRQPTLYRAVLPKGAELVKAAGQSGFRGFSRSGGKTAHAVLKPVAAGGAIAAGWPVFAVAGAVMAVDMVAQRELRAHQRRVEDTLGRMEQRHFKQRLVDQRTADAQLTRAASLILDGQSPNLEVAVKSAYDEFYLAQDFLIQKQPALESLVEPDGKVDHRKLEGVLGAEKSDDDFFRELGMARVAIAIMRKALLADAIGSAISEPGNPYANLRQVLNCQLVQLEEAECALRDITQRLAEVELKGGWSISKAARKQERIRQLAAPRPDHGVGELLFLRTATGEVVQVVAVADADEPQQVAASD